MNKESWSVLRQRIVMALAACRREILGEPTPNLLLAGDNIRVRRTARSPMPGSMGRVVSVSVNDPMGAYLVEFDNGLRFRYRLAELERVAYSSTSVPASPIQCPQ
jgi:hypothetical protein